jgi:hypothetical protein
MKSISPSLSISPVAMSELVKPSIVDEVFKVNIPEPLLLYSSVIGCPVLFSPHKRRSKSPSLSMSINLAAPY